MQDVANELQKYRTTKAAKRKQGITPNTAKGKAPSGKSATTTPAKRQSQTESHGVDVTTSASTTSVHTTPPHSSADALADAGFATASMASLAEDADYQEYVVVPSKPGQNTAADRAAHTADPKKPAAATGNISTGGKLRDVKLDRELKTGSVFLPTPISKHAPREDGDRQTTLLAKNTSDKHSGSVPVKNTDQEEEFSASLAEAPSSFQNNPPPVNNATPLDKTITANNLSSDGDGEENNVSPMETNGPAVTDEASVTGMPLYALHSVLALDTSMCTPDLSSMTVSCVPHNCVTVIIAAISSLTCCMYDLQ